MTLTCVCIHAYMSNSFKKITKCMVVGARDEQLNIRYQNDKVQQGR